MNTEGRGREHLIEFEPAYDKRPKKKGDPDYGIHGATMRWIVKGPEGAIQFVVYTNWQLPHVQKEQERRYRDHLFCHPMPADLGYHSYKPHYEGQDPLTKSCPFTNGRPCYYDGSTLNAEPVFDLLIAKGHEAVWKRLEEYYTETFGDSR